MTNFENTSLPDDLHVLMHLALDGEATLTQVAELEQRLAVDTSARTEFQRLKQMFETLDRVTTLPPPVGLADAVMARALLAPQDSAQGSQLSRSSRVFASHAGTAASSTPFGRIVGSVASFGEWIMSEQDSNTGRNRKLWIGGGVAAAAAALVAAFTMGSPKVEDTSGTIAPAQRFRAPQAGAEDVKVATPGGSATPAVDPAGGGAQNAAQGAAQGAAQNATQAAAQGAAQNATQAAAQGAAQNATQAAAQGAAQNATQAAAQGAAQNAAKAAAQGAAQNAVKQ